MVESKILESCRIAALIVAAGVGSRCSRKIPKQYIKLAGKSVLFHTIGKFLANQYIDTVTVVINVNHKSLYEETVLSITDTRLLSSIYGGKSRQSSVKLGLESLQNINPNYVVIHDACRPFVSAKLIDNLIKSMIHNQQYIGIVPATEVVDTTSVVISNNLIGSIISREKLRSIQTPQIFDFRRLLSYHESAKEFTDDSSLVVKHKKQVAIIKGEKNNFKLTTQEDINMAKLLFREPKFRIGTGYDIHRFGKIKDNAKCSVKICGIEIQNNMSIEAYSDGDVAIHAIVDAILGALGYGDIGEYFPNSLFKWKDCNSSYFLDFAAKKIKESGYSISNIDITIVCEKPKILPYKTEMKRFISKILEINDELVNIKATTAEKLGPIGRNQGIETYASVMLHTEYE